MGMGDQNLRLVCGGKEIGLKPRVFLLLLLLYFVFNKGQHNIILTKCSDPTNQAPSACLPNT